jgi:cobalt/nickel transport system permease protein
VGAGHATALHVPGTSPIHRLRPQCKLVAAVLFILVVVATPREHVWAYAVYAGVLLGLSRLAAVALGVFLRRLTIEVPFVAFAVLLPFLARGHQVEVGFLSLSVDGLWAAWNIIVKGTLGVATSVVLTATTSLTDLVRGMERLHAPRAFTSIISFMVRYAEVITGEMGRMRVARQSRGHDPRWFWQARAVAHSAGALFIRSYERGERVHLAMLARGYDGAMPGLGADDVAAPREWAAALALPLGALVIASTAWALGS